MQPEVKQCQNCKTQFTIEADDFSFYEKMKVLPPTWCPDCRFRRRSLFRNEMTLYNRTCAKCNKKIISMYNPESEYVVYCLQCYESDAWDPLSYGQDYDTQKPFFDQFQALFKKVPKQPLLLTNFPAHIDSEYCNFAGPSAKNCYLIFNSGDSEDTFYSRGVRNCRSVADAYYANKLENCYEVVNAQESNKVMYSQNVVGCLDSAFLLDCRNCQYSIGCVNLRNASYQIFNQPVTKEEYQEKMKKILGSYEELEKFKKEFQEFSLKFFRRENTNIRAPKSSGNYLFDTHNVYNCFESSSSENGKYTYFNKGTKDSYDITGYGYASELLLECTAVGETQRAIGSAFLESCHDIEYSFGLRSSEFCFGSVGLKHGSYSILNKRYSKEEYHALKDKIVLELKVAELYGQFFPTNIAPFAYNEGIGIWNLPATKEETLALNLPWQDNIPMTKNPPSLVADNIPDRIEDITDSIMQETLACISCARNYRIIARELQFYCSMGLPIPRKCFQCRHADRVALRGPFTLYERTCAHCNKKIQTTYAPERKEIVYCEECFQKEVI